MAEGLRENKKSSPPRLVVILGNVLNLCLSDIGLSICNCAAHIIIIGVCNNFVAQVLGRWFQACRKPKEPDSHVNLRVICTKR